MKILAIDQARIGAWSVFDYEKKQPVAYGSFSFPSEKYTYAKAMVAICDLIQTLINKHGISAVFIEDIQLRRNIDSFKKLAQLQGSLVSMFERNEYLYDFIPPSKWQTYCNARGRTSKEVEQRLIEATASGKKQSKALSIQFVQEHFGVITDDDNLADALCIGAYVVNNILIQSNGKKEKTT